jgi:nitrogen regulatory protein PII
MNTSSELLMIEENMKALLTITDIRLTDKLKHSLSRTGVKFQLLMHGHGSAESHLLAMLGLGDNKKAVTLSVVPGNLVQKIYYNLEKDLKLSFAGNGIAFTLPVTHLSTTLTQLVNHSPAANQEQQPTKPTFQNTEDKAMTDAPFELIITIVNRGHFDTVKNAARALGARGGTLMHGLGVGGSEALQFLGIHLQPEKDVVLIVVQKEDVKGVMKAIVKEAGINTPGKGVCFSLPVDSAYGLAQKDIPVEQE